MFTLFGFPVRINLGFIIFAALLYSLNPTTFGIWLVAALAIFTLIHEFGHAVVARHYGAHAAISLGFMAGYTSYSAQSAPIGPFERAAISLAGPVIQIVVGTVVLVAMGGSPLGAPSGGFSAAQLAIWWAGPVIGLLNLIPVLPLDGGHLVQYLLSGVSGKSLTRPMAYFSVTATLGVGIYMYLSGRREFSYFIAFLLLAQFQILQSTSGKPVPEPEF